MENTWRMRKNEGENGMFYKFVVEIIPLHSLVGSPFFLSCSQCYHKEPVLSSGADKR